MNTIAACTIALGCFLGAGTSQACSCLKEEFFLKEDGWAVEVLAAKTDIVHARVVEVLADGNARIEAINALKGAGKVSILIRGTTYPTCDIRFKVGEEFVYLLDSSTTVHLCDRLKPTPAILHSLEEMLTKKPPADEARKR